MIAVVLQFGLFSLGEVNAWFLETLGKIGYAEQEVIVPSMDGFGFVCVLFTIAVLPAVFEELMCREFLLNGLKSFGTVFAVLVSGALFALYHQKPEQTIYQFCCGMAFALVAIKSNSVVPTMVSHFLNNAFILTVEKFGWQIINTPFLIGSAICLIGSLIAYLLFNFNPSKLIMGDVGSLSLGALLAVISLSLNATYLILIAGAIYIIETISVIIQVLYYKKTKKRLFKMAPIHHHFEMSGFSEEGIVLLFSTVTAIGCFVALIPILF